MISADRCGGPATASARAASIAPRQHLASTSPCSRVIAASLAKTLTTQVQGSGHRQKRGPRPERTEAGATPGPLDKKELGIYRVFYGWQAKANGEGSLCRTSSDLLKPVKDITAMA